METKVSEILENILGLLALEGSFEVVEDPEEVRVTIETNDPGRLIGFKGETLDSLQLLVNLILGRQLGEETLPAGRQEFKRVIIDVEGWRKNKEEDLVKKAKDWTRQVKEEGKEIELEPMPAWQRRIIHLYVEEIPGVSSESLGEGRDRHLVIKPEIKKRAKKSSKEKI